MTPHRLQIEPIVRAALLEDLGAAGDSTTNLLIDSAQNTRAVFVARAAGVVCGLGVAQLTFELLNPTLRWAQHLADGAVVAANTPLATIEGAARDILTGERVALNFLTHLSGIASLTAKMVQAARTQNESVKICCTRKTTPNLRGLEKYAVRCGGGHNHRFNLGDGILIKDNHLALSPSIQAAVEKAKAGAPHLTKIEVEADTLAQVKEIIASGADAVLLDNMTSDQLRQAVQLAGGKLITEASGAITMATIADIAASGVDIISSGALTHSAVGLDIGLDIGDSQ